jgi:hypothetical protein
MTSSEPTVIGAAGTTTADRGAGYWAASILQDLAR